MEGRVEEARKGRVRDAKETNKGKRRGMKERKRATKRKNRKHGEKI